MRIVRTIRFFGNAILPLLILSLGACYNGPKTYNACVLQASRNAKNDRQFQAMSQACREQFKARYQ